MNALFGYEAKRPTLRMWRPPGHEVWTRVQFRKRESNWRPIWHILLMPTSAGTDTIAGSRGWIPRLSAGVRSGSKALSYQGLALVAAPPPLTRPRPPPVGVFSCRSTAREPAGTGRPHGSDGLERCRRMAPGQQVI